MSFSFTPLVPHSPAHHSYCSSRQPVSEIDVAVNWALLQMALFPSAHRMAEDCKLLPLLFLMGIHRIYVHMKLAGFFLAFSFVFFLPRGGPSSQTYSDVIQPTISAWEKKKSHELLWMLIHLNRFPPIDHNSIPGYTLNNSMGYGWAFSVCEILVLLQPLIPLLQNWIVKDWDLGTVAEIIAKQSLVSMWRATPPTRYSSFHVSVGLCLVPRGRSHCGLNANINALRCGWALLVCYYL